MLYQVGRYKDRETYLTQSLEVTDNLEKMVQELLTTERVHFEHTEDRRKM